MTEEIKSIPTAPAKPPRKKRAASVFLALAPDVEHNGWKETCGGATIKQVMAKLKELGVTGDFCVLCVRCRVNIATATVTKTTIKTAKA